MSDDQPTTESMAAAAVSDGAYTLLVADFSDADTASAAYEMLKSVEDGRTVEIEGVVVVRKNDAGEIELQKATDHSTKSGLKWGVVGGAVLGLIFPPSILGSAAVLGGAGAAIGKIRQLGHKSELATELDAAILPGHSAIVAMVSDPGEVEIRRALAKADRIVERAVDDVISKDIKAIAKESDDDAKKSDDADKSSN